MEQRLYDKFYAKHCDETPAQVLQPLQGSSNDEPGDDVSKELIFGPWNEPKAKKHVKKTDKAGFFSDPELYRSISRLAEYSRVSEEYFERAVNEKGSLAIFNELGESLARLREIDKKKGEKKASDRKEGDEMELDGTESGQNTTGNMRFKEERDGKMMTEKHFEVEVTLANWAAEEGLKVSEAFGAMHMKARCIRKLAYYHSTRERSMLYPMAWGIEEAHLFCAHIMRFMIARECAHYSPPGHATSEPTVSSADNAANMTVRIKANSLPESSGGSALDADVSEEKENAPPRKEAIEIPNKSLELDKPRVLKRKAPQEDRETLLKLFKKAK